MRTIPSQAIFFFVAAIAASLSLVVGCSDKPGNSAGADTNTNTQSSSSLLTAPVDYLGAVGKAQRTAVKQIDIASINKALDMYKIEMGKNPASLQDLVDEKHLPHLPDLPTGMSYSYDPVSGTVKVLSK